MTVKILGPLDREELEIKISDELLFISQKPFEEVFNIEFTSTFDPEWNKVFYSALIISGIK